MGCLFACVFVCVFARLFACLCPCVCLSCIQQCVCLHYLFVCSCASVLICLFMCSLAGLFLCLFVCQLVCQHASLLIILVPFICSCVLVDVMFFARFIFLKVQSRTWFLQLLMRIMIMRILPGMAQANRRILPSIRDSPDCAHQDIDPKQYIYCCK